MCDRKEYGKYYNCVTVPVKSGSEKIGAGVAGYCVSVKSRVPDIAWKFLKCMLSQEGQDAKPKAKGCVFSVAELSEQTGYCESEVREGIKCLISAGFITVSGTFDYIHLKTRRRFYVNKEVRLLMIHSPRRSKREKTFEEKAAEDAEARAEIQRYHSQNRNRALDRAEKNRKKAMGNADFMEANKAMKECEIELARAEEYGTEEKVKTLSQTLAEIKERRRNALKAIAMTEADLMPDYKCKKCSDTGYMKDGHMCDCYPSRGSP